MEPGLKDITTLLQLVHDNPSEQAHKEELFRLVQERLRKIAGAFIANERSDHSLQTTLLADDVYLQLIDAPTVAWSNREQFFCDAASAIRRMLVDHSRMKRAKKRGGGKRSMSLDQAANIPDPASAEPVDLLVLNDALTRLEAQKPLDFEVFQLKYFGGWELKEIAEEILGISYGTVKRRWSKAQAFLRRELAGSTTDGG